MQQRSKDNFCNLNIFSFIHAVYLEMVYFRREKCHGTRRKRKNHGTILRLLYKYIGFEKDNLYAKYKAMFCKEKLGSKLTLNF